MVPWDPSYLWSWTPQKWREKPIYIHSSLFCLLATWDTLQGRGQAEVKERAKLAPLGLQCRPSAHQPPLQHPEALGSQIKSHACIRQPVFPGFFPPCSSGGSTSSSRHPAVRWHPSSGTSLSEKALETTEEGRDHSESNWKESPRTQSITSSILYRICKLKLSGASLVKLTSWVYKREDWDYGKLESTCPHPHPHGVKLQLKHSHTQTLCTD